MKKACIKKALLTTAKLAIFLGVVFFSSSNVMVGAVDWASDTGQPGNKADPLKIAGDLVKSGDDDLNKLIIIDKREFDLYKACLGQEGNSVTFSPGSGFACYSKRDYPITWDTAMDYYSIGTPTVPKNQIGQFPVPGSVTFNFPNAARDIYGRKYQVEMIVDDISMFVGDTIPGNSGDTGNSIGFLFGFKRESFFDNNMIGHRNSKGEIDGFTDTVDRDKSGMFQFSAFPYVKYEYRRMGIKYKVSIRLKDSSGNYVNSDKRMPWLFSDIDVADQSQNNEHYDSSHTYAEHVKILNGLIGKPAVSKYTELGKYSDGAIYHKDFTGANYGRSDNTVDVLMAVNPKLFQFEWGGAHCSTEITDAPITRYSNKTTIFYDNVARPNNTTNSDGYTDNKGIIVRDSWSKDVLFKHELTRDSTYGLRINPDYDDRYYVKVNSTGGNYGTALGVSSWPSGFGLGQTTAVRKNSFKVNLDPGANKIVSQTFYYKKTNLNSSYVSSDTNNTSCTLKNFNEGNSQCIRLYRPHAYFSGDVTANIKQKKNGVESNPSVSYKNNGNDIYVELDSDADTFSVNFTNTISRNDTGTHGSAGGNVGTNYKTYVEWGTDFYSGATNLDNGNDGTTKDVTKVSAAIGNPGTTGSIWSPKYNNIKIRYNETVTYCDYLYYASKMKTDGASSKAYKCVHIHRPQKTCDLDNWFQFGVHNGQNVGRIGVKNINKSDSFTWTTVPHDANDPRWPNITGADVWAKPGDNIQFKYQMCAGAFYTIQENGIKNKPTNYGAVGYIEKDGVAPYYGTSNDGYLFKKSVPVPTEKAGNNKSPFDNKYTNPAKYYSDSGWRWTTRDGNTLMPGNGFLGSKTSGALDSVSQAEASFTSPDSGAGNSTYQCTHTGGNAHNSYLYQINGKQNGSSATASNTCHTNMSATVFDVGGTIKQTLSWNGYYINSVNQSTNPRTVASEVNKGTRTAAASVKIPYNYILAPYMKNENTSSANGSTNRVVYLGENYKMQGGVGVLGRANSYVNGATPYATITKETHVIVENYYLHAGDPNPHLLGGGKNFTTRFNKSGNLSDSADEDSSLSVNMIVADDGIITVGDKICTAITVWPADSHDGPGGTAEGAALKGNALLTNIGLEEGTRLGSANYRKTTSCSQVAKRPTMSVESSNAYSSAGYDLSNYTKTFSSDTNTKYRFTSWAEYGVFGVIKKPNTHLVSGGITAYRTNTPYGSQIKNVARDNTNPGPTATVGYVATDKNTTVCSFRTQTFVNSPNCNQAHEGASDNIGGISVEQFRLKMLSRYGSANTGKEIESSKINSIGSNILNYVNNDTGAIAVHVKGENKTTTLSSIPLNIPYEKDDKAIDRTIVYNIDGTLIVDTDISPNGGNMAKLDDIVGVVIIAKNVYFTDKPTHIDATIIAKNEVNTCYKTSTKTIGNSVGNLSSDVCNQELVFEAPVIAKKLILNRTAGAGSGANSIQRAEIFNLNMTNYLWSYSQMTHYSQAITTYSRELPSRY